MMSIATIQRMAEDQATLARESGTIPRRFTFNDIKTFPPFPFPNTGGYIPDGFSPLLDEEGDAITLFCDSSGNGRLDEIALTVDQLTDQLEKLVLRYGQPSRLYASCLYGAIVEEGEFQLVIALYTRDGDSC